MATATSFPISGASGYIAPDGSLDMKAIKADNDIILTPKGRGADAWVLYFERDFYTSAGQYAGTQRVMLCSGSYVIVQTKRSTARAAKWHVMKRPNLDDAAKLMRLKMGSKSYMRGKPLLFQLAAVDIERVKKGETPFVRYSMAKVYETRYGAPKPDAPDLYSVPACSEVSD